MTKFTYPATLQILAEAQAENDAFFTEMDAKIEKAQAVVKYEYRVRRVNGTFVNAGTDLPSWFSIEQAREIAQEGDVILLWGFLETL